LLSQHITQVIPSKKDNDRACRTVDFDKTSYRRRSVIEQMLGWIKECRRVATRCVTRKRSYLSMVKLSMIGCFLLLIAPWDSVV
jgi:transposase